MTRTVVLDSTPVYLMPSAADTSGALLVYGPGTYDSDSVLVSGTIYTGTVYVTHDSAGTVQAVTVLPLHPYQMAILPFGLFFAMALALLTTRFRV